MHLFSVLFFGLAANLDNFGIGVSFGVRKTRIPFLSNFSIATISGIIALGAVFAGQTLSHFVDWANVGGALLLTGIGIWIMLHKESSKVDLPQAVPVTKMYSFSLEPYPLLLQVIKSPTKADLDANGFISVKESIVLGASLSLNCIATGIGAGLTGLSPIPVACSVLLFSVITISSGYLTGWKTTSGRFERWSQTIAGLLLVVIGIYEIFKI